MALQARRGRNQKGICFVPSSCSHLDHKVCSLSAARQECLADVRVDSRVPSSSVVLDSRIFDRLMVKESEEVQLEAHNESVPNLSQATFGLHSTRGLDNLKVASAISKRVNDLREDLEGLILADGDEFLVARLDIEFTVLDISPSSPSRVSWNELESIHLVPKRGAAPSNLVVLGELGASAHIEDCRAVESNPMFRYSSFIGFLEELRESFEGFSKDSLFAGLGYAEEVQVFSTYDSESGERSETSSLASPSMIAAYKGWFEKMLPDRRRSASNLGDAISDAVRSAEVIRNENNLPTVFLVFSSGVFSAGPNPVKTIKRAQDLSGTLFLFLHCGDGVQLDILEAMADEVGGSLLKIDSGEGIRRAVSSVNNLAGRGV